MEYGTVTPLVKGIRDTQTPTSPCHYTSWVTYRNLSERCHEVRPKHFGIYINQSALTDWFDSIVPPQHLWLDPPVTGTLSRRRKMECVSYLWNWLTHVCTFLVTRKPTNSTFRGTVEPAFSNTVLSGHPV